MKHQLVLSAVLISGLASYGQQVGKEYIRLGSRVIAIENNGPPEIVSIVSSVASGYYSVFTITVRDYAGYQNISIIDLLINSALDGRNACFVAFVPSSASTGTLYLVNDAGNAGGPFASGSPVALPGSGTSLNSQCVISASSSSVSASGNVMTLSVAVNFQQTFSGNKVLYVSAGDPAALNSGWQSAGTFSVGPTAFSVSPASGTGWTPPQFVFSLTDPNGWGPNSLADVLLNNAIDARSACYFGYVPQSRTLFLVNDAGQAGGPFAGTIFFSPSGVGSGTATNSQCTINGNASSFSIAGTTLTLRVTMSFTSSFAGDRIFYVASVDGSYNSGWQSIGSWIIP